MFCCRRLEFWLSIAGFKGFFWLVLILVLKENPKGIRFTELHKILKTKTKSGASSTVSEALKELKKAGLIEEIIRDKAHNWVDYKLTPFGKRIANLLSQIIETTKEEYREEIEEIRKRWKPQKT